MATAIELESLGLDQQTIEDRVVDALCDRLLTTMVWDDENECERTRPSSMRQKLNEQIAARINTSIAALAEKHVLPQVDDLISGLVLQTTNSWGEKVGAPVTLTEYIVQRAEEYMQEMVDHNGKSKSESGSNYSWKGAQTRLAYAIDSKIQYAISAAMKQMLADANQQLVQSLSDTCRAKLNEISKSLKVQVSA